MVYSGNGQVGAQARIQGRGFVSCVTIVTVTVISLGFQVDVTALIPMRFDTAEEITHCAASPSVCLLSPLLSMTDSAPRTKKHVKE